jgi:hypothetical protein
MPISIDEILDFAGRKRGQKIKTIGEDAVFTVELHGTGIRVQPSTGVFRSIHRENLQRYLDVFNATRVERRFVTTTYTENFRNPSYVLGIFRDILARKQSAENDQTAEDLAQLLTEPETTRLALLQARVGQGKFRADLLSAQASCYVTGIADERFLRASHIKPWKDSTTSERLDPDNGILLSPTFDHLFDKYFITFEEDGRLVISRRIPAAVRDAFALKDGTWCKVLSGKSKTYLAHHRAEFRQRENAAK